MHTVKFVEFHAEWYTIYTASRNEKSTLLYDTLIVVLARLILPDEAIHFSNLFNFYLVKNGAKQKAFL